MPIYNSGRPSKYRPSQEKGSVPPEKPGEYRIRSERNDILYIGETNNLHRRMNEHIRTGKLSPTCSFEYQVAGDDSDSVSRREHERQKIGEHSPTLNKSRGGEGRIAVQKK